MKTFITTITLMVISVYSINAQEILTAKTSCIQVKNSIPSTNNVASLYNWVIEIESKFDSINHNNDFCYEAFIKKNESKSNFMIESNYDYKKHLTHSYSERKEASSKQPLNNGSNLDLNYGLDLRINI